MTDRRPVVLVSGGLRELASGDALIVPGDPAVALGVATKQYADAIGTASQPVDSDLGAIAALAPSNDAFIQRKSGVWTSRTVAQVKADIGEDPAVGTSGLRTLGTGATQAAAGDHAHSALYQPLDSDLTTIAGLTATTDNFMVAASSAWASRTPAQAKTSLALVKADVGLGSADNTSDASKPISTATQAAFDGQVIYRHTPRTTSSTSTTTTTATSAQKVMDTVGLSVLSGRLYRIAVEDVGCFSSAAGRIALQFTYTTNGTTPAANSTRLSFVQSDTPAGGNVVKTGIVGWYVPGSNLTLKVLLSIYGQTAGTYSLYGASDWPMPFVVEDCGLYSGSSGTNF